MHLISILVLVFCCAVAVVKPSTTYRAFPTAIHGARKGKPTHTNSCYNIRKVPAILRKASEIKPKGIDNFYQKYTEAYGIPVVSSSKVSDDALKRACYILRFLLADHSKVRNAFYRMHGRVSVMATKEKPNQIPEYRYFTEAQNKRYAGGIGGTPGNPVSVARVDNTLCHQTDPYRDEDIFLHELAHGVQQVGASYGIKGWDWRLKNHFTDATKRGLFKNTYSSTDYREMFAENTQAYFNAQSYSPKPNGVRGPVNTRAKLKKYDFGLYELVKQVFPCNNDYLKRCTSTRKLEEAQKLKMDCDLYPNTGLTCRDEISFCQGWAKKGLCTKDKDRNYMKTKCQKSCNLCKTDQKIKPSVSQCNDNKKDCGFWKTKGYCSTGNKYTDYMKKECPKSCGYCKVGQSNKKCVDLDSAQCPGWAKSGYCNDPNYKGSLKSKCRKSCKYC